MAGLTPTGLVIKTFEEIRAEIEADFRAAFGESIPLGDTTILGQVIAIIAEREASIWELAETVNSSQNPDDATGAQLEAIAALTGTLRLEAASSTVTLTLAGTATTVVALGSQASTLSSSIDFQTTAEATIAALTAWTITTAYVIGDRVTNGGDAWICTIAGTSAGSGGPDSTGLDPGDTTVDATVTWRFIGAGAGAVDVEAESVDTGELVAVAFDIITIETPVGGWDSVINLNDADLGQDIETDEALRVRREVELAAAGTSTVDAIRTALLDVTGVTTVNIFNNPTDVTDADGVPPHAIEALIQGGADQDLFDALLANVAAGIATFGTTSGTAEDSSGTSHTMAFTRPTEIDIYIDITLDFDADLYPTDGDDQIKTAITVGSYAGIAGRDAVSSAIKAACFAVTGVLDVSLAEIDTSPAPTLEVTIAIGTREIADYDTSRITVASSAATP